MATASQMLAEFATGLTFEKIPPEVLDRAKTCIIDTVAAATFGAGLPWSKIVIGYAERNSAPGNALILGTKLKVRAPFASLANGALAHAFEMDSLCHPSVNVHPGALHPATGAAATRSPQARLREQPQKPRPRTVNAALCAPARTTLRETESGAHPLAKANGACSTLRGRRGEGSACRGAT